MKTRILYFFIFFVNFNIIKAQIVDTNECVKYCKAYGFSEYQKNNLKISINNYLGEEALTLNFMDAFLRENGLDSNRSYGFNNNCPFPDNYNFVEFSTGFTFDNSQKITYNSNIKYLLLYNFINDSISFLNCVEILNTLPNLKLLDIFFTKVQQIPLNIKKLGNIEYLEITVPFNIFYPIPKSFLYKIPDGIYEMKNLKQLTINIQGYTEIKQDKISNLKNLERFNLITDSLIVFNDSVFVDNGIKELNIFTEYIKNKYPRIDKYFDKENKFRIKRFPNYILNCKNTLTYFNTNYYKLIRNDKRIASLKKLKFLNGCIFKELKRLPKEIDSLPELEDLTIISKNRYFINKRLFAKNKSLRRVYFIGKYLPQNLAAIPKLKELSIEKVKKGFENLNFLSDSVKQLTLKNVDLNKVIQSIQNHHFNKVVIPLIELLKPTMEHLSCIAADTLEISNINTSEFYKLRKKNNDYNFYKNFNDGEWFKNFYSYFNEQYLLIEYLKFLNASNHFKVITYTN